MRTSPTCPVLQAHSMNAAAAQKGHGAVWWLYLLACKDGRTYAGIAIDVDARFRAHASGKGSKFTRSNRPLRILGAQPFPTKSAALRAEHALKRLQRPAKLQWARAWAQPSHHAMQHAATELIAGRPKDVDAFTP